MLECFEIQMFVLFVVAMLVVAGRDCFVSYVMYIQYIKGMVLDVIYTVCNYFKGLGKWRTGIQCCIGYCTGLGIGYNQGYKKKLWSNDNTST